MLSAGLALASALMFSACVAPASSGDVTSTPSASATATKKPSKPPVFLPDAVAKANLYYFSWTIEQALAADPAADSFAIAQKVAEAGFDPAAIQFTFSRTAAGLAADSVDVAVNFAGECIVGQFGPAISGVHAVVMPVLASGGCLLGTEVQTLG
jgi:hypothetical protein